MAHANNFLAVFTHTLYQQYNMTFVAHKGSREIWVFNLNGAVNL